MRRCFRVGAAYAVLSLVALCRIDGTLATTTAAEASVPVSVSVSTVVAAQAADAQSPSVLSGASSLDESDAAAVATAEGAAVSTSHGALGAVSSSPSPSPSSSSSSLSTSPPSPPYTATCQSKTVNYITHTLPQQCLRTRPESTPPVGTKAAANDTVYSADGKPVEDGTRKSDGPGSELSVTTSPPVGATAVAETADAAGSASAADTDTESPLDNANFLSFEDWKKQNLEKAGQSPEHVGQGRGAVAGAGASTGRKRPDVGSLESLGEEGEIDFDFGGFVGMDRPPGPPRAGATSDQPVPPSQAPGQAAASSQVGAYMRSRDAGKTCKERYNYASFDCAATVLKTNPRCRSSASVLVENKDSYMLNECAVDNKFLIVELCDDIIVDTVVLANFEFFSSMVRTFRVSVSDRYPPKPGQWIELGTFEARNSREIQAFLVEGPRVWARYLRVELLTHYGNEYYCPVSLLRVHGITMMEEYKHEEERSRGEAEQEEQGIEEAAGGAEKVVTAEAIVAQAAASASASAGSTPATTDGKGGEGAQRPDGASESEQAPGAVSPAFDKATERTASSKPVPSETPSAAETSAQANSSVVSADAAGSGSPAREPSGAAATADAPDGAANSTAGQEGSTKAAPHAVEPQETQQTQDRSTIANTNTNVARQANSTDSSVSATPSPTSAGTSGASGPPADGSGATASERPKSAAAVAHPPAPSPSTQESFFKSVDKRLKALESNASLSLQYIEEQSRILRDAFTKVERRQLNKTAAFLEHLNATVMTELGIFRTQYDQLWQSTVIELETHREQYQREIVAISSRLTLLADEVVFQKRMAVVQSTLLMLCLGFVLFVKSGAGTLELPLMQSMMSRGGGGQKRAVAGLFESPPDSPDRPGSPTSGPQSEQRSGLSRFFSRPGSRGPGSPAGARNPTVEVSAPTPVDRSPLAGRAYLRGDSPPDEMPLESRPASSAGEAEAQADLSETDDDDGSSSADEATHTLQEPRHVRSGPATPQGTRDNPLDWTPPAPGSKLARGTGVGVGVGVDVDVNDGYGDY